MSEEKQASESPSSLSCCSDAFCIGEYVSDMLTDKNWTTAEAVKRLDGDPKVNELWLRLISSIEVWWDTRVKFTEEDAFRLEKIFSVSAQTWMNIHARFQAKRQLGMN